MTGDISGNQTKQITFVWLLESDSNHCVFHQSTQYHIVVRDPNTQESKRTLFFIRRNGTKCANFQGSPYFQAAHNIKTEKQTIQHILCQLDVGGWWKEKGTRLALRSDRKLLRNTQGLELSSEPSICASIENAKYVDGILHSVCAGWGFMWILLVWVGYDLYALFYPRSIRFQNPVETCVSSSVLVLASHFWGRTIS